MMTAYEIKGISDALDILDTKLKINCFLQQLQQAPQPLHQPPQLQQPLQQPQVRNSTISFDQYRYKYDDRI